ncbi:hypothetical protein GB928_010915 [Shinella curvata]|uniref:HEXXH motif-containing protein n=1 Tax=Shinella curvata TaxID=1817964 RepID=A0ABT8XD69_9HYPH|nr:hypothetical protein [Shinella curvata]MCJ8055275.1 hypothetical protein [Shinella curvata]MDO6121692.1 hypothetical protein [Shinella curvata]
MIVVDESFDTKTSNNLGEWLDLHGLSEPRCCALLRAVEDDLTESLPSLPMATWPGPLDPNGAWQRALAAMLDYFPDRADSIARAYTATHKVRAAGDIRAPRAMTVADGGDGFPTVYFSFDGGAASQMAIAHEFAHALQVVASGGVFTPPVTREICAFVGEAALLQYLEAFSHPEYMAVVLVWRRDEYVYCHHYAAALKLALHKPTAKYSYEWNYPIARLLAREAKKNLSPDEVWRLFEGKEDLGGLMAALGY